MEHPDWLNCWRGIPIEYHNGGQYLEHELMEKIIAGAINCYQCVCVYSGIV